MEVYVDESGHSGQNIFDEQQPIFSAAGVWMDSDVRSDLEKKVDAIRAERNVQMPELKGGALGKTGRGRRILRDLGDACNEFGVQVSLICQHKPFMAASVIVEDGADPLYNPAFSQKWYRNGDIKQKAALLIHHKTSQSIRKDWWDARQESDLRNFIEAHNQLTGELIGSKLPQQREFGHRLNQLQVRELWDTIKTEGENEPKSDFSPNSSTFAAIVQLIHHQASYLSDDLVDVIHDEQAEYEEEMDFLSRLMKRSGEGELHLSRGNTLRLPTDEIRSLRFEKSDSSVPIQLADCFAAVARLALEHQMKDHAIPEVFSDLLMRWHHTALDVDEDMEHIFAIGPLDWQQIALYHLIGGRKPDHEA